MCKDRLSGSNGVGVIRPAGSGNHQNLFCFRASRKKIVSWDVLQSFNSKCNLGTSVEVVCLNAIWKWCESVGYSGGIPFRPQQQREYILHAIMQHIKVKFTSQEQFDTTKMKGG